MDNEYNVETVREMSDAPTLMLMTFLFVLFAISITFFEKK